MKVIPDKSVDMILCDLPYGATASSWDVQIPIDKLWVEYKRIIKDAGVIVLTATQPFTSLLVASNLKWFKYEWIWDKVLPSGFQIAKHRPMMRHESVLVFSKGKPKYNPIMTPQKPRTGKIYGKSESSPLKYDNGLLKKYDEKNPQSIIQFYKRDKVSYHPTQKPLALFEYLIKTYTDEGDLVLDNAAGSGTTAIACMKTKRNYIVMEKEQKYFDVINERVKVMSTVLDDNMCGGNRG